MATPALEVEIAGRSLRVVDDLVAVSGRSLRGVFERPTVLERIPEGAPSRAPEQSS